MLTIHFWNVADGIETSLDPWDVAHVTLTNVCSRTSSSWAETDETEVVIKWHLGKGVKRHGQSGATPIHPAVASKITHYSIELDGADGELIPILTRVPRGCIERVGQYYGNPKRNDCSSVTVTIGHDERLVKLAPAIDRTTLRDGRIVPKLLLNLRLVALSAAQVGLALDDDTLALLEALAQDAEDTEDQDAEDTEDQD